MRLTTREPAFFSARKLFSTAFVLGADARCVRKNAGTLGAPSGLSKLTMEAAMTEDSHPTQTSTRGDALLVIIVFSLALAIAAYFANPAFAAQIDGARTWIMALVGP